jgi:hypothetical protein
MYTWATSLPNLYIRNIIPDDMVPLREQPGPRGWGDADLRGCAQEQPHGIVRSALYECACWPVATLASQTLSSL